MIKADDWQPIGVPTLEKNAWRALRHTGNACVVAGPGAGKTEFLAQKATYLLQTGQCRDPQRILAISFKREAAHNLAARVEKRCPPEQAKRFSSLTFDAFTKGLVDRFREALPEEWRPPPHYEPAFPRPQDFRDCLDRALQAAPPEIQNGVAAIPQFKFEADYVGRLKLPIPPAWIPTETAAEFAIGKWWEECLSGPQAPQISFTMINRLAELLVRYRPHILAAIRQTYPFVFVDEFQDTTHAQYDLLKTLFHGSSASVTTVGDDKQRIMLWAGAMPDAFNRFQEDFNAERIPLLFNFRSSPELVRIQHVIALAMEKDTEAAVAQTEGSIDGDAAQVWTFRDTASEIEKISDWVAEDIAARGTKPRDYALIVRQLANNFETEIKDEFAQKGLLVRNEARQIGDIALQDLISEEFTKAFTSILRLCTSKRHPAAWRHAADMYTSTRGIDPGNEAAQNSALKLLENQIEQLKSWMERNDPTVDSGTALAKKLIELLGEEEFKQTYPQYMHGDLLQLIVSSVTEFLSTCAEEKESWSDVASLFEGTDSIPLMTIHRSKGLEFDTVIFIGLDDSSWWSYSTENPEGKATFFVALSRARQRAIFTYCTRRGNRQKISDLYELLTQAGVPEIDFST